MTRSVRCPFLSAWHYDTGTLQRLTLSIPQLPVTQSETGSLLLEARFFFFQLRVLFLQTTLGFFKIPFHPFLCCLREANFLQSLLLNHTIFLLNGPVTSHIQAMELNYSMNQLYQGVTSKLLEILNDLVGQF